MTDEAVGIEQPPTRLVVRGIVMMDKKASITNKKEPTIANGIDDDEELEVKATKEEVAEGEATKVTKLVYDEYDPSLKQE